MTGTPSRQSEIVYAERRWGHGRLLQKWRRFVCREYGHEWGETKWEGGFGMARCQNLCGAQLWQWH